MVKTRPSQHAKIVLAKTKLMIDEVFGNSLVHNVLTRTVDVDGQLTGISTVSTTFTGDLQTGLDLDHRYIESGVVEVGDGVLYVQSDELSTLPLPDDQIVDGDAVWEVVNRLTKATLGGTSTHQEFRLKRLINSSDNDN